jgi:hypothetical protein
LLDRLDGRYSLTSFRTTLAIELDRFIFKSPVGESRNSTKTNPD